MLKEEVEDLLKEIETKIIYKNRPFIFNSTTEQDIRESWENFKKQKLGKKYGKNN
jgi:hypothetical protein